MPVEEKKTQCEGCTIVDWVCTKPTGEVCTPEECAESGCEATTEVTE